MIPVLYGRRLFFSKLFSGKFNCPKCGDVEPYSRTIGRMWWYIYYLPIVPRQRVDYVACLKCGLSWSPTVLPPTDAALRPPEPSVPIWGAIVVILVLAGAGWGIYAWASYAARPGGTDRVVAVDIKCETRYRPPGAVGSQAAYRPDSGKNCYSEAPVAINQRYELVIWNPRQQQSYTLEVSYAGHSVTVGDTWPPK